MRLTRGKRIQAAAIAAVVSIEYRRPLSPLTREQRGVLAGLRVVALTVLAAAAACATWCCVPVRVTPRWLSPCPTLIAPAGRDGIRLDAVEYGNVLLVKGTVNRYPPAAP